MKAIDAIKRANAALCIINSFVLQANADITTEQLSDSVHTHGEELVYQLECIAAKMRGGSHA